MSFIKRLATNSESKNGPVICPYCEAKLETLASRNMRLEGRRGVRMCWYCPECQKILGVT